jgi:3-hydroxyisobutyrate dehydrogenase-like beta-hydroxyacid dehydrogenase
MTSLYRFAASCLVMLTIMNLAFIGLGKMGTGMARNLLRAGHTLAVYNRGRAKAEALAREGARVADSPADACRDADAVMTMLADDQALEQIVFGKDGIAPALKKDGVHLSHSTISTALARRLTAEHAQRNQGYLSVPVFGRPEAAETKKLGVVTAGPAALIERCRPLFEAIGRHTYVVGTEPWQANVTKLCGNFMAVSVIEAFGEIFATLRKAGVEPKAFLEIIDTLLTPQAIGYYGHIIAEDKFEPAGFALRLGLKDVRLMLAASEECMAPMPLASLIHDQLLSALANGQGEMDWSSVARVSARSAGL